MGLEKHNNNIYSIRTFHRQRNYSITSFTDDRSIKKLLNAVKYTFRKSTVNYVTFSLIFFAFLQVPFGVKNVFCIVWYFRKKLFKMMVISERPPTVVTTPKVTKKAQVCKIQFKFIDPRSLFVLLRNLFFNE